MIRASPEFLRLLERYELAVLANPQSWHWKDAKGTPVVVGRTQAVIPKLSAAEKQRFASFLTWMSTTFKDWDGVTEGTASLLATLEQEGVAAQASPAVAADGQAGGQGGAQKAGGDVQRDQRQGLRAHIYDVLRAVRMTTRQGTLLLRIITASGVLWSHAGRRRVRHYLSAKVGDAPVSIQIDMCRLCQYACTYCSVHGRKQLVDGKFPLKPPGFRGPTLMSLKECARIIDQHPEALLLQLQGQGEPTLNPAFSAMIRYAKQQGMIVYSFTNGAELTTEKIDGMLRSGLDALLFSLDVGSEEEIEQLRRGMDYDAVVAALRRVQERKRAVGARTLVGISAVVTKRTQHELHRSLRKFKSYGADFVLLSPLVTTTDYLQFYHLQGNDQELVGLNRLPALRRVARGASLPVVLSVDLSLRQQHCVLLQHAYYVLDEGGLGIKGCQNWHSSGPTFRSVPAYLRFAQETDEALTAFCRGERETPPAFCAHCLVAQRLRRACGSTGPHQPKRDREGVKVPAGTNQARERKT